MATTATIIIPVLFDVVASGDGLWDMAPNVRVVFSDIEVQCTKWDEEEGYSSFCEVRAHHNRPASKFGLCYTDKAIEKAVSDFVLNHDILKQVITGDISGSEQGMQGSTFLSCDATIAENITSEFLETLGFTITEH